MDLETKIKNRIVFVKPLNKNIDSTVSTEFKSRIIDLLKQGNYFYFIDLSSVDFIDSSGLGTLISLLKSITLNNGALVFCHTKKPVENLFNITRMNLVFKIYENENDAIEYLNSSMKNHVQANN